MIQRCLWGLLLGVLLSGCAASGSSLREEETLDGIDVEAETGAVDSCLVFLCDEEVCGFYHCEDVAEAVAASEGSHTARYLAPLLAAARA